MTDRERLAEARALLTDSRDVMLSVRIFVTSRERIKHPEGEEWFNERIERIRAFLAQPDHESQASLQDELVNSLNELCFLAECVRIPILHGAEHVSDPLERETWLSNGEQLEKRRKEAVIVLRKAQLDHATQDTGEGHIPAAREAWRKEKESGSGVG